MYKCVHVCVASHSNRIQVLPYKQRMAKAENVLVHTAVNQKIKAILFIFLSLKIFFLLENTIFVWIKLNPLKIVKPN